MKKCRSANFSDADVDNLVSICLKYSNIIESKCTDTLNNRAKANAWEKITQEYCAQYPPRPKTSLREKYDGLKRFIKKRKADEKVAHKVTSGGPPPKQEKLLSETLTKLANIIYLSVDGLLPRPGPQDYEENVEGDVSLTAVKNGMCVGASCTTTVPATDIASSDVTLVQTRDVFLVPTLPVCSTNLVPTKATEASAKAPNWGNYTLSMLRLRRRRHAAKILPTPPRRNISEKQNELEAKRAEIISRDATMAKEKHDAVMLEMSAAKKRAIAQHTLAIANMRTTARLKNKLLVLKIKVQMEKKKQQLREHKLRMGILKAELSNQKRRYSSSDSHVDIHSIKRAQKSTRIYTSSSSDSDNDAKGLTKIEMTPKNHLSLPKES